MTIKELSERLASRVEEVCSHLLPSGRRIGSEWCVGDLDGNQGKSLKVKISGGKAGLWCDFAGSEKGDLVALWMQVRRLSMFEALKEIRSYLGISEPQYHHSPQKVYKKPSPIGSPIRRDSVVRSWLTDRRKLDQRTIDRFEVKERDGVLVFPYIRDGELYHEKYRKITEKTFWSSKDTEPILFGWQALPDDARTVTICEGEIDCMTLHQYGYAALSIPCGAGDGGKLDWIDSEYERLSSFDEICLCMDMDKAGQEALPALIRRLGRERCRIVKLPHKDPNECLMAGLPSLDPYFMAASSCDPEGLHSASEFMPAAMEILMGTSDKERGISLPWSDNLHFRPSELTVWHGYNGQGKSSLLNHLSVDFLSRGEAILYCSHEMSPERLMAQMVRQACGDGQYSVGRGELLSSMIFKRLYIYVGKTERIEAMRYAVRRYGCSHIIVDNLTRLCPMDDYRGQQEIVQSLADLKDSEKVHIHLIAHARKAESESMKPDKHDVKGAGAITDIADNVVGIHRNKTKMELLELSDGELYMKKLTRSAVEEQSDAKLYVQKQRVDGWEGSVKLWFDRASCQFGAAPHFSPRRFDEAPSSYDSFSSDEW